MIIPYRGSERARGRKKLLPSRKGTARNVSVLGFVCRGSCPDVQLMLGANFSPAPAVLCREAVLSTIPEPRAAPGLLSYGIAGPMSGLHAGWCRGTGLETGLPPLSLETFVQPPPAPGSSWRPSIRPALEVAPAHKRRRCSRWGWREATWSPRPKGAFLRVSSGSFLTADAPASHTRDCFLLSLWAGLRGCVLTGSPQPPHGWSSRPPSQISPPPPVQSVQCPHCLSLAFCSCRLGHSP